MCVIPGWGGTAGAAGSQTRRARRSRPTCLLLRRLHLAMHEKPVEDAQHREDARAPERERVEFAAHEGFVLAGLDAEPAEDAAPQAGADKRPEREFPKVHLH